MTSEKDNPPLSDTEGGEKPVREQLRKAHITSNQIASQPEVLLADPSSGHSNGHDPNHVHGDEQRGRLHRKRSHEDIDSDDHVATQESGKNHTRKRSRDSTIEEDQLDSGQRKVSSEQARPEDASSLAEETNGVARPPRPKTPEAAGEKRSEAAVEAMTSPKTKRSRLHSTTAEPDTLLSDSADVNAAGSFVTVDKIAEEAILDEDLDASVPTEDGTAAKLPSTSGFANTSAVSPFGSLAGSKSPAAGGSTSASAFAASGFSALSGSSKSGFGAVGKQTGGFGTGGSFASSAKSPDENDKPKSPPTASFGGTLGAQSAFSSVAPSGSGFGSNASGFGKLGPTSGFSSVLGGAGFSSLGGSGLSGFGSGKPATLGGSFRPARPFGAPADDDDAENADDDSKSGAKSPLSTEEEKQDERFYEQELETGEEDEITEFYARAKLYNFAPIEDGKKEWRERGLGVLRFNVGKASSQQESNPKGRLLMRADGSHRLVLNTPILKDLKFGAPAGGPPQGGYIYFMGTIDGKESLELLQLKMKQVNALELHNHITALQERM